MSFTSLLQFHCPDFFSFGSWRLSHSVSVILEQSRDIFNIISNNLKIVRMLKLFIYFPHAVSVRIKLSPEANRKWFYVWKWTMYEQQFNVQLVQ